MKKKLSDILKEAEIAKEKAEEAEDYIVIFHEPTKNEYGYAINMENDPEIKVIKIYKGTRIDYMYKYKGKYYSYASNSGIPIEYVEEFISAIRELLNMEIEV